MEDIYTELLIENYKHPKNWGVLEKFTHHVKHTNEQCGDELEIYLNVENDRVKEIAFTGHGCAMCLGTMSLLSEKILHDHIENVKNISDDEVLRMVNVPSTSSRIKCVLLGIEGLRNIDKL